MEPQPSLPQFPSLPPFGNLPNAPQMPQMPQQTLPSATDNFASFDAALSKSINSALNGGLDAIENLATPHSPPPSVSIPQPPAFSLPGVAAPPVPETI